MYKEHAKKNIILPSEKIADDEAEQAKNHWRNTDFSSYIKEQPWSKFIAERVLSYNPERVFEFGCNAGKNIEALVSRGVDCYGVDINKDAVFHALSKGLKVATADEYILKIMPDKSFDVCFTVSVLDHLPEPGPVLKELARLSNKALLLLEPWLGVEGKVVKNFNVQKNKIVDTTPYSYSWDYVALGRKWLHGYECSVIEYPLNTNLGRYYNLYSFTMKPE